VNPARAALIESYLALPAGPYSGGWRGVPSWEPAHGGQPQFLPRGAFVDAQFDPRWLPLRADDREEQVRIDTHHHDFIARMVLRLQKYSRRGIVFVNCPDGALTEDIHILEKY